MATFMPFPSSGLPDGSFKFHASGAPIVGPPIFGASSLVALFDVSCNLYVKFG
ncbi:Uncharacterised protein [Streptococcus pneumoniae]|nr:Uncharacterised protein [Streptococcus pneumoniae]